MQICGRLRLTCWMFRISWNLISGRSPASGLIQSPQLLCPQKTLKRKCSVFFLATWRKCDSFLLVLHDLLWNIVWYCLVLNSMFCLFSCIFCFGWRRERKSWGRVEICHPRSPLVQWTSTLLTQSEQKVQSTLTPHLKHHTNGNLIEIYQYYGTPTTVLHRLVKSTQSVKGFASFFRFLSSVEPLWTSLSLFELAIPWVISH